MPNTTLVSTRLIELAEKLNLDSNDFLMIDNSVTGTTKFSVNKLQQSLISAFNGVADTSTVPITGYNNFYLVTNTTSTSQTFTNFSNIVVSAKTSGFFVYNTGNTTWSFLTIPNTDQTLFNTWIASKTDVSGGLVSFDSVKTLVSNTSSADTYNATNDKWLQGEIISGTGQIGDTLNNFRHIFLTLNKGDKVTYFVTGNTDWDRAWLYDSNYNPISAVGKYTATVLTSYTYTATSDTIIGIMNVIAGGTWASNTGYYVTVEYANSKPIYLSPNNIDNTNPYNVASYDIVKNILDNKTSTKSYDNTILTINSTYILNNGTSVLNTTPNNDKTTVFLKVPTCTTITVNSAASTETNVISFYTKKDESSFIEGVAGLGMDNLNTYSYLTTQDGFVKVAGTIYSNPNIFDLFTMNWSNDTVYFKLFDNSDDTNTTDVVDSDVVTSLPHLFKINIVGAVATDSSDARTPVNCVLEFMDESNNLLTKVNGQTSIQGNGSANYVKKGYTLDIFNADYSDSLNIKFGDWVSVDSFHLKAYYTDATQTRDVGSVRLWKQMYNSLDYPNNLIQPLTATMQAFNDGTQIAEAKYYTEGRPVIVTNNGTFYGLYTLRLKKDRANYGMKKADTTQIFLDSTTITSYLRTAYTSDTLQNFWEFKNPKKPSDDNITKSVAFFTWMNANYNTGFTGFASHMNLNSFVLWYILQELIYGWDTNGNNYNLVSYDGGATFSILPYDLDNTIGLKGDGNTVSITKTGITITWDIWSYFYSTFKTQIQTVYTSLRNKGILNMQNFISIYGGIAQYIPSDTYKDDYTKWGNTFDVQGGTYPSIQQIYNFLNSRLTYLDTIWKV